MGRTWQRSYPKPRGEVRDGALRVLGTLGYPVDLADDSLVKFRSARGQLMGSLPFTVTLLERDGSTDVLLVCDKDKVSGFAVQKIASRKFLEGLDAAVG